MPGFDDAYRMLYWLVTASGGEVSSAHALLQRPNNGSFTDAEKERMREVKDAAIPGFFHMAAKDQVFCPLERVTAYYGRTVQQAYPGCSRTFYRLTNTYFTFKVELIALGHEPSLCSGLLRGVDLDFSGLFYPTPGPFGHPPAQREAAMRTLIGMSRALLDLEDFIRGNPYLRT
ncbi:MAG: hypothetical protein HZB38_00140 [Planctomycetes bacterium]|nr:hypothetical protein [Planctomycetota bacterium]